MIIPLNKLDILEDRVSRALELLKKLRDENEVLLHEKRKIDEKLFEKEKIIKKITKEKDDLYANQEILREKIEHMIQQLEKLEEKKIEKRNKTIEASESKKNEDELI